MATDASRDSFDRIPAAGGVGPPLIGRARALGPWPWVLLGWMVALALVVVAALGSWGGPRTAAVEQRIADAQAELGDTKARLERSEPDSTEAQALREELVRLRAELLELQAERGKALGQDTRDGLQGMLWEIAELLLVGGGAAYGVNRYRTRTRARDLGELDARLAALEAERASS